MTSPEELSDRGYPSLTVISPSAGATRLLPVLMLFSVKRISPARSPSAALITFTPAMSFSPKFMHNSLKLRGLGS